MDKVKKGFKSYSRNKLDENFTSAVVQKVHRRLIGSLMLDYHFGAGRSFPPRIITLTPTDRCNLKCRMCGQWGPKGYKRTRECRTEMRATHISRCRRSHQGCKESRDDTTDKHQRYDA